MKFFYLLLGGLVAYRLSLMISKEDGPAYIFRKLRKLPPEESSAKAGLSCEWCMSIWTGAAVALYLWRIGVIAIFLIAAVLRLYNLNLVPLHHDEGVNGNFLVRLVREGA